jgi:phage terminase large subunit
MVVSEAARIQLQLTTKEELIDFTIAPPDMWARNRESGKTQASLFAENGVGLLRADNNRLAGWAALKELFKIRDDGKPGLLVFDTCTELVECIKSLQHDQNNTNDVAKKPHEITHGPDALRYFAQTRLLAAEQIREDEEDEEEGGTMDYMSYVCGTGVSRSYISA